MTQIDSQTSHRRQHLERARWSYALCSMARQSGRKYWMIRKKGFMTDRAVRDCICLVTFAGHPTTLKKKCVCVCVCVCVCE